VLVEPPGRDAKAYGFVEEEGYEANDLPTVGNGARRLFVMKTLVEHR
jgi:hypothetical protein